MAKAKKSSTSDSYERTRPALSPEAREKQLIAKAMNLAERQIDEGTASSQVITHFLKLATVKNQLELEKLRHENNLTEAKIDMIQSTQRTEELYQDAIKAMRSYSGMGE